MATSASRERRQALTKPVGSFNNCKRFKKLGPESKLKENELPCGPYLTFDLESKSFKVDGSVTATEPDSWMYYDYTLRLASSYSSGDAL